MTPIKSSYARGHVESRADLLEQFPDLSESIEVLGDEQLRAVALSLAQLAIQQNHVLDYRVDAGLAAFKARQLGDTLERAGVESLVEELDDIAWTIQEQVDVGLAEMSSYADAFKRARAANVLYYILDSQAHLAFLECLYEAVAAVDDDLLVEGTVDAGLGQGQPPPPSPAAP